MNENRNSMIAAAVILVGFGLFFYYLPDIFMAAGGVSPWLGVLVMIVFIGGLFFIFWLRARAQRRRDR